MFRELVMCLESNVLCMSVLFVPEHFLSGKINPTEMIRLQHGPGNF